MKPHLASLARLAATSLLVGAAVVACGRPSDTPSDKPTISTTAPASPTEAATTTTAPATSTSEAAPTAAPSISSSPSVSSAAATSTVDPLDGELTNLDGQLNGVSGSLTGADTGGGE